MAYLGGSSRDFPSLTGIPDGVQAQVHTRPQLPVPSTSCGPAAGWESWVGQGPAARGDPAFPEVPGGKDGVSGWASGLQDPQALSAPTHSCQMPLVLPGTVMNPETLSTSTCIRGALYTAVWCVEGSPHTNALSLGMEEFGKHLRENICFILWLSEKLTALPTPSQGGKPRPRGANSWARFSPPQSWDAIPQSGGEKHLPVWEQRKLCGHSRGLGRAPGPQLPPRFCL